jgi:hypothetical protein
VATDGEIGIHFTEDSGKALESIEANVSRMQSILAKGFNLPDDSLEKLPTKVRSAVEESIRELGKLQAEYNKVGAFDGKPNLTKIHNDNASQLGQEISRLAAQQGLTKGDAKDLVDKVLKPYTDALKLQFKAAATNSEFNDPKNLGTGNIRRPPNQGRREEDAYNKSLQELTRANNARVTSLGRARANPNYEKLDTEVTRAAAAAEDARKSTEKRARSEAQSARASEQAASQPRTGGKFTSANGGPGNASAAAAYASTPAGRAAIERQAQVNQQRTQALADAKAEREKELAEDLQARQLEAVPTVVRPQRPLQDAGRFRLDPAAATDFLSPEARARLGTSLRETARGYGDRFGAGDHPDLLKLFGIDPKAKVTPGYQVPFAFNPSDLDTSYAVRKPDGSTSIDRARQAQVTNRYANELGTLRDLTSVHRPTDEADEQARAEQGRQRAAQAQAAKETREATEREAAAAKKAADEAEEQARLARQATAVKRAELIKISGVTQAQSTLLEHLSFEGAAFKYEGPSKSTRTFTRPDAQRALSDVADYREIHEGNLDISNPLDTEYRARYRGYIKSLTALQGKLEEAIAAAPVVNEATSTLSGLSSLNRSPAPEVKKESAEELAAREKAEQETLLRELEAARATAAPQAPREVRQRVRGANLTNLDLVDTPAAQQEQRSDEEIAEAKVEQARAARRAAIAEVEEAARIERRNIDNKLADSNVNFRRPESGTYQARFGFGIQRDQDTGRYNTSGPLPGVLPNFSTVKGAQGFIRDQIQNPGSDFRLNRVEQAALDARTRFLRTAGPVGGPEPEALPDTQRTAAATATTAAATERQASAATAAATAEADVASATTRLAGALRTLVDRKEREAASASPSASAETAVDIARQEQLRAVRRDALASVQSAARNEQINADAPLNDRAVKFKAPNANNFREAPFGFGIQKDIFGGNRFRIESPLGGIQPNFSTLRGAQGFVTQQIQDPTSPFRASRVEEAALAAKDKFLDGAGPVDAPFVNPQGTSEQRRALLERLANAMNARFEAAADAATDDAAPEAKPKRTRKNGDRKQFKVNGAGATEEEYTDALIDDAAPNATTTGGGKRAGGGGGRKKPPPPPPTGPAAGDDDEDITNRIKTGSTRGARASGPTGATGPSGPTGPTGGGGGAGRGAGAGAGSGPAAGFPLFDPVGANGQQLKSRFRGISNGRYFDTQTNKYVQDFDKTAGTGQFITDKAAQYTARRDDLVQNGGRQATDSSVARLQRAIDLFDAATGKLAHGVDQISRNLFQDTRSGAPQFVRTNNAGARVLQGPEELDAARNALSAKRDSDQGIAQRSVQQQQRLADQQRLKTPSSPRPCCARS